MTLHHSLRSLLTTATVLALGFSSSAAIAQPIAFFPTQGWKASQDGQNCQVSATYNNGYTVSFSGDKNSVNIMSIDLQQDAFVTGSSHKVVINVGGAVEAAFDAVADSPQVLSINISDHDDLYQATKTASAIDINIEDNPFRFHMNGFAGQSAHFDTCGGSLPVVAAIVTDTFAPISSSDTQAGFIAPAEPDWEALKPAAPIVNDTFVPVAVLPADIPAASLVAPSYEQSNLERQISTLQSSLQDLRASNRELQAKLAATPEPIPQGDGFSLSSADWNLEKATLRYQEAERQTKDIGQKLQRERAKCNAEKAELETLLFDPQLTNERQLAELANLEDDLAKAEDDLHTQRVQFEERIKVLQEQLAGQ